MTLRSRRPWFDCDREAALMAMLAGGVVSPGKEEGLGLHSYFMPLRRPARDYVLFSSCTAMPMLEWGFEACAIPYRYVIEAEDPGDLANRLGVVGAGFERKLLAAVSAPAGTSVVVVASPTDALAATLFALEGDGQPARVLMPSVLEMDSDVPLGAQGRCVRPGPDHGEPLLPGDIELMHVPLRHADGDLLDELAAAEGFRARNQSPKLRTIAYTTFGDATGAAGAIAYESDIMDATQMRIRGSRIGDHLKRRFAMVISGSTFLGGPAHSGALLVPPGAFKEHAWSEARRLWAEERSLTWSRHVGFSEGFANMLRWMPGLQALETMAALGPKADIRIAHMTQQMAGFLRQFPDFEVYDGRSPHQVAICGRECGIVPFSNRRGRHWLTMPDLIGLYRKLAEQGVLLGHPVPVGNRAALRLSIAAGDVYVGSIEDKLARLADVLAAAGFGRQRTRAFTRAVQHTPGRPHRAHA